MKMLTRNLFVVLCSVLTASCWIPETFTATIHIDKAHHFDFTYTGTLVYSEALGKFNRGERLSLEENAAMMKLASELRSDPKITSVTYAGNGRARITYHETGVARPGTKFFMDLAEFRESPSGNIQIVCIKVDDAGIQQALSSDGLALDGTIRLTSESEVIEHNAQSTPWFGGLIGSYKWHVGKKPLIVPSAIIR